MNPDRLTAAGERRRYAVNSEQGRLEDVARAVERYVQAHTDSESQQIAVAYEIVSRLEVVGQELDEYGQVRS